MKNIFLILFAVFLSAFTLQSCKEHDDIPVYESSSLHFIKETQTGVYDGASASGNNTIEYSTTRPVSATHSVNLVYVAAESDAVLGTDFTIVKGTDDVLAGEAKGDFVINVTPTAAIAGKHAVFTLASSSLESASFKQKIKVTFNAVCPSQLQGDYTYSTVNYGVPGSGAQTTPLTGTGSLTVSAAGVYNITDAAFGVYQAMWSPPDNIAVTGIKLVDSCDKLSFTGANVYGDTWAISNVIVNGSNLTFDWITSYNEYGTTTLTRTDGSNWPSNLH